MNGMTYDQIIAACGAPSGMFDFGADFEPETRRELRRLVANGTIERREHTADIPARAVTAGVRGHANWLGADFYDARSVTVARYYLTAAAVAARAA